MKRSELVNLAARILHSKGKKKLASAVTKYLGSAKQRAYANDFGIAFKLPNKKVPKVGSRLDVPGNPRINFPGYVGGKLIVVKVEKMDPEQLGQNLARIVAKDPKTKKLFHSYLKDNWVMTVFKELR